ncbi:GAF domain-containing protein [Streptomyces sp. NPDC048385]|uniref:GAF domain-containing protein n=1 Tax=unclassified Streptomyces TaxID=2593676 RepID=UPI00342584DB
MLQAAMHRVVEIIGTSMGNVQEAEDHILRMRGHAGLNREFTEFFALVGGPTTACARAAQQRRQITIMDVTDSEVFDNESRCVIIRAGSLACHSVPLLDGTGTLLGVISAHWPSPGPS